MRFHVPQMKWVYEGTAQVLRAAIGCGQVARGALGRHSWPGLGALQRIHGGSGHVGAGQGEGMAWAVGTCMYRSSSSQPGCRGWWEEEAGEEGRGRVMQGLVGV